VVPNILNYRGAFTCGIKNAPRPFEMLESTHPTTHYPIPEHLSIHNIFHLIYRMLQELKETLESLVFTMWKVFVYILIQLGFSVLDSFHVVTVLFERIPETCRKEHLYS
jgi:hypothetical protein